MNNKYSDAKLQQDFGSAGVGSVDLLTGELEVSFTDFGFDSGQIPLTATHCFNGSCINDETVNYDGINIYSYGKYGKGWKMDFEQFIVPDINENSNRLLYVNSNCKVTPYLKYYGKSKYLLDQGICSEVDLYVNPVTMSGGIYKTTVKYLYNSTYFTGEAYIWFDGKGNSAKFVKLNQTDKKYTLCESKTNNGNCIYYNYTDDGKIIISRNDPTDIGCALIYQYSYDRLITAESGKLKFNYSYDSVGRLIAIEQNGGNVVAEFTYDTAGNLTSVKNEYGKRIQYNYEDGKVVKVEQHTEYSSISPETRVKTDVNNETVNWQAINYSASSALQSDVAGVSESSVHTDYYITTVTTNTGLTNTYHIKSDEYVVEGDQPIDEKNKRFYTCLEYEGDFVSPQNIVYDRMSFYGNRSYTDVTKNNLLKNYGFEDTPTSGWDVEGGNFYVISQAVEGKKCVKVESTNENEYCTVFQEIINEEKNLLDEGVPIEVYKLNSGIYTLMAWVKAGTVMPREFVIKAKYAYKNNDNQIESEKEEILVSSIADIGEWQCLLSSFAIAPDENKQIDHITISVEFKGESIYLDNFSLTCDQSTTSGNAAQLITFNPNSNEEKTYLFDDPGYKIFYVEQTSSISITKSLWSSCFQYLFDIYFTKKDLDCFVEVVNNNGEELCSVPVEYTEINLTGITQTDDDNYTTQNVSNANRNVIKQKIAKTSAYTKIITELLDEKSFMSEFKYDDVFRNTETKNYRNIVSQTSYDDLFRKETISLTHEENTRKIVTSSQRNAYGETIMETDECGNITQYQYENNLLTKVTLPNGKEYNYEYDNFGRLTKISFEGQTLEYSYTLGLLTGFTAKNEANHTLETFALTYDGFGNNTQIKHGDKIIYTASYFTTSDYKNGSCNYTVVTKNGETYKTEYDKYNNPTKVLKLVSSNEYKQVMSYSYDQKTHELTKIEDYSDENSETTAMTWEFSSGTNYTQTKANSGKFDYTHIEQASDGAVKNETVRIGDITRFYDYTYQTEVGKGLYPDHRLENISMVGNNSVAFGKTGFSYDEFGRLQLKIITDTYEKDNPPIYGYEYHYVEPSQTQTTNIISQVDIYAKKCDENGNLIVPTVLEKTPIIYFYDENNNITKISSESANPENNYSSHYYYDSLNRLIRENNTKNNTTTLYTYDDKGNILFKTTCPYTNDNVDYSPVNNTPLGTYLTGDFFCGQMYTQNTTPYTTINGCVATQFKYDEKGRLISVGDKTIEGYNDCGNPAKYMGHSLTWDGPRLKSYDHIRFEYDANGYRTKKINSDETTYYFYDEKGNLLQEKLYYSGSLLYTITYIYVNGECTGFSILKKVNISGKEHYEEQAYYYIKDIQGNVIQILDKSGQWVVKYYYDAWGNTERITNSAYRLDLGDNNIVTSVLIAKLNGMTYRGYYYDRDLGMYYLIHRYYDPEIGRFISIDDPLYLDFESLFGTNRYAYCLDNPVMGVDPEGNFVITLILISTTIIGAVALGTLKYVQAKEEGKTGGDLFWATLSGILLGAGIGLAAGGLIVATTGVLAGGFGVAGINTLVLGLKAYKVAAIGFLAFDAFAMVIAPLYGIVIEPLGFNDDTEKKKTEVPKPQKTPTHPYHRFAMI